MRDARQTLLDDTSLVGRAWCASYTDLADGWLADLFTEAMGPGASDGIALVAVGGYGRGELAPKSDLDVVLVHGGRTELEATAARIWYPVWDAGLRLGHAVLTIPEALALADRDLESATSLLSARHVAGDASVTERLARTARTRWETRPKHRLKALAGSVAERQRRAGDAAFLLEPNLKDGRGGLRDRHAIAWAEAAHLVPLEVDADALADAYDTLLGVRVALHRVGSGEVLGLEDQDAVADALGHPDADALMRSVSAAARTIAWVGDTVWRRVATAAEGSGRRGRDRRLGAGVTLTKGEITLDPDADPHADPVLVLRAAAMAAAHDTTIAGPSLARLVHATTPLPDPWPQEARGHFVDLLLAGSPAIAVIETLDQVGLWSRLIPEWDHTRSLPQRSTYHTYTVDRHLVEAAVRAASWSSRVRRPDLLVVGALLHDIGKGLGGDHSRLGMPLAASATRRMGFAEDDVATVVTMVEHHLLLPDVATRRDLDDPSTIADVAASVGDIDTLTLLAALTEADALATGPSAWGRWKAGLVEDLTRRVAHLLTGGAPAEALVERFPTDDHRALLARGDEVVDTDGDTLTVVTVDRPGVFSQVAGVLALHGLTVREANALSTDGYALARFRVEPRFDQPIPWPRVTADLAKSFAGRFALAARLDARARAYAPRRPSAAQPHRTGVTFHDDASTEATVIEVSAADTLGVLHAVTKALGELALDIRSAKVTTIGAVAVDTFYVCTAGGDKVTDSDLREEVERAIVHAVASTRTSD